MVKRIPLLIVAVGLFTLSLVSVIALVRFLSYILRVPVSLNEVGLLPLIYMFLLPYLAAFIMALMVRDREITLSLKLTWIAVVFIPVGVVMTYYSLIPLLLLLPLLYLKPARERLYAFLRA